MPTGGKGALAPGSSKGFTPENRNEMTGICPAAGGPKPIDTGPGRLT